MIVEVTPDSSGRNRPTFLLLTWQTHPPFPTDIIQFVGLYSYAAARMIDFPHLAFLVWMAKTKSRSESNSTSTRMKLYHWRSHDLPVTTTINMILHSS